MACLNKNRHRPRTVAFRLTDEEFMRLEQRVKVTGEVKGDYLRAMTINGEIKIAVGKYKSDKLALAIRNISRELEKSLVNNSEHEFIGIIREIQILIEELSILIRGDNKKVDL